MNNTILCPVFPDTDILFTFRKKDGETEWNEAYNKLTDIIYLEEFFSKHETDLLNGHYKGKVNNVTDAVMLTKSMAEELFDKVLSYSRKKKDLNSLFKNLNKHEYGISPVTPTRMQNEYEKCHWLRLYGIRIEGSIISISGGTIKLTQEMHEREHTRKELDKLSSYKVILIENSICDGDSLMDYIENT